MISVLQVYYNISSGLIVGAMHDRASVNTVATRTVTVLFPNMFNVGCFLYTLDIVGESLTTLISLSFLPFGLVC